MNLGWFRVGLTDRDALLPDLDKGGCSCFVFFVVCECVRVIIVCVCKRVSLVSRFSPTFPQTVNNTVSSLIPFLWVGAGMKGKPRGAKQRNKVETWVSSGKSVAKHGTLLCKDTSCTLCPFFFFCHFHISAKCLPGICKVALQVFHAPILGVLKAKRVNRKGSGGN